ncbi:hypothetical protein [Kutzneria sp. 744]|uniref:hypothetical protein n=1 Tax=Kutzneria sp. (strain 744) TaxID=345341 RepID=UPI0012FC3D0D|nr:hypothetical protein [Kutzneria sp. 744]
MSAAVDRLPFAARMRALAEHALLLTEAEYRSVHRELDSGDGYHRHLALHYATVRRDVAEVVRALGDPVLRRRALAAARRVPVPDEALVELVETAPRGDRLLVYGLLKRTGRWSLADALLPKVFERRGRVEASRLLPACSPGMVEKWLPRTGADLSVRQQLVKTAPKVMVAAIRAEPGKAATLLERLVVREPEAVGEFLAENPRLCRTTRLAVVALRSTSDVKKLWPYIRFDERARVLAELPEEQRRGLIDQYSTVNEIATLPLGERREYVRDRKEFIGALPFAEVAEQLLDAVNNGDRASAWSEFLACAVRNGDGAVFAEAVARTERAWTDWRFTRTAMLEQLVSAPRRLLDAVPKALWQRMIDAMSGHLDQPPKNRRALRRLKERIGVMTERQAVELVARDPRHGLEPEVWAIIAGRRTDLVDDVLKVGWPGPTSKTGRWHPVQRLIYEKQAARLAMDDAAELTARVEAAKMVHDQGVLIYLLDRAPQSLALAALRGITAEHVLVRCVQARRGPISRLAARRLADLVDGELTAISVGGEREQARLLAETRPPTAVDRLLRLWQHGHRDLRTVAMSSLVTFLNEDPRVAPAVAAALADHDDEIRQAVLREPVVGLTRDQSVRLARLVVDAIPHGREDVIGAYGKLWGLAPDGFDRVVEHAGKPGLSAAVVSTLWAAADTEAGDRAAMAVLARISGETDWLRAFRSVAFRSRSTELARRYVDTLQQSGMVRFAVDALTMTAMRSLDPVWWRELVVLIGDRPDRVSNRSFIRPREWNEAAAEVILAELQGIGGYVPTRLALQLVHIGGASTNWAQPWPTRLAELRAHEDEDIRELAAAVPYPS